MHRYFQTQSLILVFIFIFLGGSNRLTRRNSHQVPHVVILAGPNNVGIQAICAARHLANHKVCF